ncbi:MAG: matrixin family metalloprotease [Planctomycetaceae bacterium]
MLRNLFNPNTLARRSRRNPLLCHRSAVIEFLEARLLLTANGLVDVSSLTISFAPDGTHVGGHESSLHTDMADLGTEAEWQDTILSAFRTWMQEINGDVQMVSDGGQDFGVAGLSQGDSRFGDIRVAAVPLSDGIIAVSVPHNDSISGTWAGDVLFNSEVDLANLDELFSITLHESGHILGLQHSTDPASVMFSHANTSIMAPTADDLSELRRLYGSGSEGSEHETEIDDDDNDDVDHPEELINQAPVGAFSYYQIDGSIQSADDVDHFLFTAGEADSEKIKSATIVLQTWDLSGRLPEIALLTSSGKSVESTVMVTTDGRIILQPKEVEAGKAYIVRVNSTGADTSCHYRLTVSFSSRKSETPLGSLSTGTLDREKQQKRSDLYVAESQLFTFAIAAKKLKRDQMAGVAMSIFDSNGTRVFQMATATGQTVLERSILLAPGAYTVLTEAVLPPDTRRSPEIEYQLFAAVSSLPVGPSVTDPTNLPEYYDPDLQMYLYPGHVATPEPYVVIPDPNYQPYTYVPPAVVQPTAPLSWEDYLRLMGFLM